MEEQWREIAAFPQYRVSNLGNVQNVKTERILHPSITPQGHLKINLLKDGVKHTRQVNQLVGQLFLDAPQREDFISTIHLDGRKKNCQADNLLWRPRFFAIRYHMQFETPLWKRLRVPVVELKEQREYKTAQEAAMANGLVLTELLHAAYNKTFVWPTYQQFRTLLDYT